MYKEPYWQNYNDDCLECYFLTKKRKLSFSGKLFLSRELCDNIYWNQCIIRRAWLTKGHFQLFLIISPFFLVNLGNVFILGFFFLFLFCFEILRLTAVIYPLEDKNLERVIVSKITQIIYFFLLEIKLICLALIIWNHGQVVLSSGMWTKQKQTLETESSKFMAVSACSICQYLWCHNQIKTIPSAIYISTMPRLHTFMPVFLSSFKTIQMSHLFYSSLWGRVNCFHLYSFWSQK